MNRRNLRKRVGGGYAVVYNVPKVYQDVINKREIVRGLGTRDEKEAIRLDAPTDREFSTLDRKKSGGELRGYNQQTFWFQLEGRAGSIA